MTIKEMKDELNKISEEYDNMELNVCIEDNDIIDEILCRILGEAFVNEAEEGTEDGDKVNQLFSEISSLLTVSMKNIQYREDLFKGGLGKMFIVGDSYMYD